MTDTQSIIPEDKSDQSDSEILNSKNKSAEEISQWLKGQISGYLFVDPTELNEDIDFNSYGLSSRDAILLSGDLEEWLGRRFSPTLVYEYPSISLLAQFLADEKASNSSKDEEIGSQISGINLKEIQNKFLPQNGNTYEPIAVIGIACKFPGADNPQAFWDLLINQIDAISEIPKERWNVDQYYDPEPGKPGKMYTRWGGFLPEVDRFDAEFFNISPREAEKMDPQQRILAEVSWNAFENAGIVPSTLSGSLTGVFIGISSNDYIRLQSDGLKSLDAYVGTGNAFSIAANRLSYFYNFHGPSISIDTACSSSLVSIHLACQSLHTNECDLALAGGVNLILSPELNITFSQARMMAADGRCKSFDARADGYVRGEGCGIAILKRLSDALKSNDKILGIIRGSAINQDGRSNGLTAPNPQSQESVIRRALDIAKLAPEMVSYIETHGTGTALGDPIEAKVLGKIFSSGRQPGESLRIGSVKSNIGHLEAAAGIAGFLKIILMFQHRKIPASLHFEQPNTLIPFDELKLLVQDHLFTWSPPLNYIELIAGLSSFGFGGTNAHIIVSEPPPILDRKEIADRSNQLLCLSGKDETVLRELAIKMVKYLQGQNDQLLGDICFSANTHRSHFSNRLAVMTNNITSLCENLEGYINNQTSSFTYKKKKIKQKSKKLAFLFTGQGSQYPGMGRELFDTNLSFRNSMLFCEKILEPFLKKPLLSVIYPKNGETIVLNETEYTQPALFALEYSLAQMWLSWGIEPDFVMGHSLGEYVAATFSGVFSLEDGLLLVYERARLMQSLPRNGEMAVIFASMDQIAPFITNFSDRIAIAAINGPNNIVISGDRDTVRGIVEKFNREGMSTRVLNVSHAFHSPLMDPILNEFENYARKITKNDPTIPLISNFTGKAILNQEDLNASYWRNQIRKPVQFQNSIQTLIELGVENFIEVGPSPSLLGMAKRCITNEDGFKDEFLWLPSLVRDEPNFQSMLGSLGELYVNGSDINWSGYESDYLPSRNFLSLPNYPFRNDHFWIKSEERHFISRSSFHTNSDLLPGNRIYTPHSDFYFQSTITKSDYSVLNDFRLKNISYLTSSLQITTIFKALFEIDPEKRFYITQINFPNLLFIHENDSYSIHLSFDKLINSENLKFTFYYWSKSFDTTQNPEWLLICEGFVTNENQSNYQINTELSLDYLRSVITREISLYETLDKFNEIGMVFNRKVLVSDDPFNNNIYGNTIIWKDDLSLLIHFDLAQVDTGDGFKRADKNEYIFELCMWLLSTLYIGRDIDQSKNQPIKVSKINFLNNFNELPENIWCYIHLLPEISGDISEIEGEFIYFNEGGEVVLNWKGIFLTQLNPSEQERLSDEINDINQDNEFYERNQEFTGLRKIDEAGNLWLEKIKHSILMNLPSKERCQFIEKFLLREISNVLKIDENRISVYQPINYLGLDSIMAIDLKNRIDRSLDITTPISTLLQGPNIQELSFQINEQLENNAKNGNGSEKKFLETIIDKMPTDRGEYPLTPGQRAMWFQHQVDPASVFNPAQAVLVRSILNPNKLKANFQLISDRHPALRTTFVNRQGELYQIIHENIDVFFYYENVAGWSYEKILSRLTEESHQVFDILNGPLFKVFLFSRSESDHILMICAHHLVVDLWSLAIIINEFFQINASTEGQVTLNSLNYTYPDFVNWQKELLSGPIGDTLWEYWKQKLAGELPVLDLPTDHRRPAVQTHHGGNQTVLLNNELSTKLQKISEKNGSTLFMLLLAAFKVLLFRYSGQEDIIIGTPTTGRSRPEFFDIVGYFVNPVPIRSSLKPGMKFTEYLEQMRQVVIDAMNNQDFPMVLLAEKLHPERDPSVSPIYQVMFVFQRSHLLYEEGLSQFSIGLDGIKMQLADLSIESITLDQKYSPFDLTLTMARVKGGLGASITYNSDLFETGTINRMLGHFETLLDGIASNPDSTISTLPILPEKEFFTTVFDWNQTDSKSDLERCIHQWFESQVEITPDSVAISFDGKKISYKELNKQANQLAHYLQKIGVKPGNIVGIYIERSIDMVVSILGVLKAGGAYIPLDPIHPIERLAFMLQDAMIKVIITQSRLMERLPTLVGLPVFIDTYWGMISQESDQNPNIPLSADNLAYVIYTSGSTGRSKGVLLQHRGLVNLVNCQTLGFKVDENSRILQFASFGFDASVSEIFMALTVGATLVLARREILLSVPDLHKLLQKEKITTVTLPPSLLSMMPSDGLPKLKTIISAGESCSKEIIERWAPGRTFINAYGPTETTIGPTYYKVTNQFPEKMVNVPIGKPISNMQIYILDKNRQPVPIGFPGEIYIGGVGLAKGYINRPELTEEKFVPNPFYELAKKINQKSISDRIYKTGDLGRYLEDGNIEFLGRVDFQVKIRGFRIELGEIESIINQHSAVQQVVVISREDTPGDKRLVAYIVLEPNQKVSSAELRAIIRQKLPDYMIPSKFIFLEAFPLNSSGKVDRNVLASHSESKLDEEVVYISPQSDLERTIATVWQEVLAVSRVGLNDNFFDLGGHSLLMAKAHTRLQELLGKEFSLIDLFRYPTVSSLAEYLSLGSVVKAENDQTEERADRQKEAMKRQVDRLKAIANNRKSAKFPDKSNEK